MPMETQFDLDLIDASDVNALSIEERVAAFFQGTGNIDSLMNEVGSHFAFFHFPLINKHSPCPRLLAPS